MKPPVVMLLIDADNVSTDVMEQGVAALLDEYGALHVRRAYCTAESAVKHQALFKRLSIRPMVNLAAGKNSTDIALAVDALDLAVAERPDVVAIASSDSDFAPLVTRLREKGCRVVGIGQRGKTGDETQTLYDDFTVMAHRRPAARKAAPAERPPRAPSRAAAARPAPSRAPVAAPAAAPVAAPAAASVAVPAPVPAPVRKAAPRKKPVVTPPAAAPAVPDKLRQILIALPELVRGATVELRVAAERLREAGLLTRSGSSTKVFGAFPEKFELVPARNPNQVRLKA